ncbi:hypothetical protein ACF06W_25545 [Streptomyces albus]|uniref:hypothetical protein n=1 Tax=Streptomyces albus TaxID=1888 RepID=UPI0036F8181B
MPVGVTPVAASGEGRVRSTFADWLGWERVDEQTGCGGRGEAEGIAARQGGGGEHEA